jgi:hypothetical protein
MEAYRIDRFGSVDGIVLRSSDFFWLRDHFLYDKVHD